MRVLILCTGNSCRSQMAEACLKSLDARLEVVSAGTAPAAAVHPDAIAVMREIGIDISRARPKNVDDFLADAFDVVVTVCDNARESCPVFTGPVKRRIHIGFDDPAGAAGTIDEVMSEFRRVRDEIREEFNALYIREITPALASEDAAGPRKRGRSGI